MALENEAGGFHRLRAVGTESQVASIVKEQVGATMAALIPGDVALQMAGDARGGDVGPPVETHGVPEHGGEAKVAGGTENVRAAGAVRRAEVADWGAEDVFKSGIASGKFFADAAVALHSQPGMGDSVVADEVTCGLDLADDVWPPANVAADEEKGGADTVLREEIEEASGPGIIGAVVIGQGELCGIGAGNQGAAEELGLRI